MMAGLFVLMTLTIAAVFFGPSKRAVLCILGTLVLCLWMFWHHVTESLQIAW